MKHEQPRTQQQSSVPPMAQDDFELLNFNDELDSQPGSQHNMYNQHNMPGSSNKVSDMDSSENKDSSNKKKKKPAYDDLFIELGEEDGYNS